MATKTKIDISEDVGKPVGDLKRISALGAQLVAKAEQIAGLEYELKIANQEYSVLELETIPAAMMEVGLSKFTLTTGEVIESAPYTRASIPTLAAIEKADPSDRSEMINRRETALNWLKTHNASTIIKNDLIVSFGKGQDEIAKKMYAKVLEEGFKAKCEESVNFQTLNAFVKETLAKGIDIPFEPFSIFSGHKAVIKKAK